MVVLLAEKKMTRRDDIRAAMDKHDKPIPKTTVGKGKNYLPTEQGAGMTAKGRAAYNAKNGSNLQAPQASGSRHDSFCARSAGWNGERGKAARARWKC
jgi:hypothetical protein